MRTSRALVLLAALLALPSQAHAAQGVNLRWNTCLADGGVQNKNFACNVNTGLEVLAGSFKLSADLANVSGNEIVVDLAAAGGTVPAWWLFRNPGTCRATALGSNFAANDLEVNCPDWGAGLAIGGIGAYNVGVKGPHTARIILAEAVPPDALQLLSAGQEYLSVNLTISHAKTVGTGACAGCNTPVCLVLISINLTTPVLQNNRLLTGPTNGTDSYWATWQGGIVSPGLPGCPFPLPTVKRTWNEVKALYR